MHPVKKVRRPMVQTEPHPDQKNLTFCQLKHEAPQTDYSQGKLNQNMNPSPGMKTISKCLKKQAVISLCRGSQAIKGNKQN